MAPNVRYRQTVEAVVLVPHGADVSELGRAHDTVAQEARARKALHDRDEPVVVRWAVVDDGIEYRAVLSESTGAHLPVTHRPGQRGEEYAAARTADPVPPAAVDDPEPAEAQAAQLREARRGRSAVEHRAEAAP